MFKAWYFWHSVVKSVQIILDLDSNQVLGFVSFCDPALGFNITIVRHELFIPLNNYKFKHGIHLGGTEIICVKLLFS